mgnify:CR=1 FL=1
MIEVVDMFCGSGGLSAVCVSLGEVIGESIQKHVKAMV